MNLENKNLSWIDIELDTCKHKIKELNEDVYGMKMESNVAYHELDKINYKINNISDDYKSLLKQIKVIKINFIVLYLLMIGLIFNCIFNISL